MKQLNLFHDERDIENFIDKHERKYTEYLVSIYDTHEAREDFTNHFNKLFEEFLAKQNSDYFTSSDTAGSEGDE